MMMPPGRNFVNASLRLRSDFFDDDGVLIDPTTVKMTVKSPNGSTATYTYETDDELGKLSTGKYYCDLVPNVSGRWFIRWEATDATATVVKEGNFLVDYSPHVEGTRAAYGLTGNATPATDPYLWQSKEW